LAKISLLALGTKILARAMGKSTVLLITFSKSNMKITEGYVGYLIGKLVIISIYMLNKFARFCRPEIAHDSN